MAKQAHGNAEPAVDLILRPARVSALLGLSLTTIWRLRRRGEFPPAIHLSPNAVGWRATDVAAWVEERAAFARGKLVA